MTGQMIHQVITENLRAPWKIEGDRERKTDRQDQEAATEMMVIS